MGSTRQVTEQDFAAHAVATDFCRIFEQDMNRLCLLSFLLTADYSMAERCFVGGLEDSARSPRVFKEWAHSWARRMVIQNAIQMLRLQLAESSSSSRTADRAAESPEISAVLELPVLERFVFVMSVLEQYSDQDCALLLDCTRGAVMAARVRALQQIGKAAETYRKKGTLRKPLRREIAALATTIESIPLLATLP